MRNVDFLTSLVKLSGWALCAGAAALLARQVLAPQLVMLFSALEMHNAEGVGTGLAYLILLASMAAKLMPNADRGIVPAIVIITVCVGLVRVKVENGRMTDAQGRYEAELAAYEEAQRSKEAAIRDALADPDLDAVAPYLARKLEARANLAAARAMPLPLLPVEPHTGWDAWLVNVAGQAGLEAATAILIKVFGGKCGELLALILMPMWGRREEEPTTPRAAMLRFEGVEPEALDDEARRGLDLETATWRGLPLGEAKRRNGVLWPTLETQIGGRTVFVGSQPARRLAGQADPKRARPRLVAMS